MFDSSLSSIFNDATMRSKNIPYRQSIVYSDRGEQMTQPGWMFKQL